MNPRLLLLCNYDSSFPLVPLTVALLFQFLCWKSVVTYFRNVVRLKEQCWVNITILSPKHIFALDILPQGLMHKSL